MRDCRLNTVHLTKFDDYLRRHKTGLSNPHDLNQKTNNKMQINFHSPKAASKPILTGEFQHRDSGRITTSPYVQKHRQKAYLDHIKQNVRIELQRLSYREKLNEVEEIFKSVRELCRTFGYFTVTLAMLEFQCLSGSIKISTWIHPDKRSNRPLHPIRKETEFECELVCAAELKDLMKTLFPTVDLGNGKTFANVIGFIDTIKSDMDKQLRKTTQNFTSRKGSIKINEFSIKDREATSKDSCLLVSMKTMPVFECSRMEEAIEENNRKKFKVDQKHKETTSTLIDSFKSANSIRDKLKFEIATPAKLEEKKEETEIKLQRKHLVMSESVDICKKPQEEGPNEVHFEETPKKKKSEIFLSNMKESNTNSRINMKTSSSGRRLMSMSIEIESEINNLFGSNDDMVLGNYYRNSDLKGVRNSVLSKVAEEFEDLF